MHHAGASDPDQLAYLGTIRREDVVLVGNRTGGLPRHAGHCGRARAGPSTAPPLLHMNELMNRIHEGMHVVDVRGEDVGKVDIIRMGDSEAATTAGNEDMPNRPFDLLA